MPSRQPPITPEQLAALPPDFQALLLSVIEYYESRIAELEAQLNKSPQNSSLPPSSQHPHAKPPANKPKSKKQKGGQPGHAQHQRPLVPTDQCDEVQTLKPSECRRCGNGLTGSDPQPLRHQVWELPEIRPLVTEYQRHRLSCPACGETSCAALPPGVPAGQAGPRLISFVAVLMGSFRQSKRKTASFLQHILNTPCSPGWVVKLQNSATDALRGSYNELAAQLPEHPCLGLFHTPGESRSIYTHVSTALIGKIVSPLDGLPDL